MSFADDTTEADPVRLALRLLLTIADDPMMRGSYRVAAMRGR